MLPFVVIFALIFLFGLQEAIKSSGIIRNITVFYAFVFLVMLATVRSVGVGSDDAAYFEMFKGVPAISECENLICGYSYSSFNIEFGFFLILSILSLIGKSQYVLFGFVAASSVYLNLKVILKLSPYIAASVLVYYSHFFLAKDMNAIRLGLASSILFYSAHYLYLRKYKNLVYCVFIASFIHISSVLFLIPVVFFLFKPSRGAFVNSALFCIGLSFVLDVKFILSMFSSAGFVDEKLQLYMNASKYNYSIPLYDIVNLKNIFAVAMSLFCWESLNKKYKYFYICFCFFFTATFFRIVFGDFAIIAGRGYAVFSMFEYIILPMISVGVLGRFFGFIAVSFYSVLVLYLNLISEDGWSGGVKYFSEIL